MTRKQEAILFWATLPLWLFLTIIHLLFNKQARRYWLNKEQDNG